MTLVDTNILLDVISNDVRWATWSMHALTAAKQRGGVFINEIIWSELSIRYQSSTDLNNDLEEIGATNMAITEHALFLSGKAYLQYRRSGGVKSSILPDFFIGAQAQTEGWTLLTRDAGRFKTYFPQIKLITPETA